MASCNHVTHNSQSAMGHACRPNVQTLLINGSGTDDRSSEASKYKVGAVSKLGTPAEGQRGGSHSMGHGGQQSAVAYPL